MISGNNIVFIKNAGGMIVTKSLLEQKSTLKWIYREEPHNHQDNGWRAIGDTDTQAYMDNPSNLVVVDFNTLANIEPAVVAIFDLPVGADLMFVDGKEKYFVDVQTGKKIE